MKKTEISIVIPSYNQGKYIEETLLSVLNQGIEGLQLIVMDGGSTDETVSILEKYSDRIDVWVSEKDRGQTDAINKGMKHVKGDIIGWINSDDVYIPGALRKVMDVFRSRPEVDVIHGDRLLLDAESHVVGWACGSPFQPHQYGFNVNSETAFWRTGALAEPLDTSLRFAMDLDWFSRLYASGAKFHFVPDFLGGFRCHAENKSSTMQDVAHEETALCWGKHFGNEKWRVAPPGNRARFYGRLLTRPLVLTAPYARHRFARIFR
ncbi:glycosyltransferase family 2 protein [Variovorax boronicumulans]|uniref:glycosyltransferase family 2 protein n=1 Tax=Variovorax boronicumulans TaxID=436515 RepID=UPI001C59C2BE